MPKNILGVSIYGRPWFVNHLLIYHHFSCPNQPIAQLRYSHNLHSTNKLSIRYLATIVKVK